MPGCLVRTSCPPSALYCFWQNGCILRIGLILKEIIRNRVLFQGALECRGQRLGVIHFLPASPYIWLLGRCAGGGGKELL